MVKDKVFKITYMSEDGGALKGNIVYHGMQMDFTLNRQSTGNFRGRMTVISPYDGKNMVFEQKRLYAKDGNKKAKMHFIELNLASNNTKLIQDAVLKRAEKIYADNSLLFRGELRQATTRDTITPEVAGHLYAEEFVDSFFVKAKKENTRKNNLNKLRKILAALPNKPMKDIAASGVDKALKDNKSSRTLLQRFWAYCIVREYCPGPNPVRSEADQSYTKKLQAKLDKITSASDKTMAELSRLLLDQADGTACGVALLASGFSAEFACSLHWKDVSWPTADRAFAIVAFHRPELLCAVHDYSRPVLPITAMTLFKRKIELLRTKTEEEIREFPVVSLVKQPEIAMRYGALKQEAKQYLINAGIKDTLLSSNDLEESVSVSATALLETYKRTLVKTCGIVEKSGTYLFMLGRYIDDVTSANYTSFTCPAGERRLYKYLRAAMPIMDRGPVARVQKQTEGQMDRFQVYSDNTMECAGMICDLILQPGQQFSLEAETGLDGSITVTEYHGTSADTQTTGEDTTTQKQNE